MHTKFGDSRFSCSGDMIAGIEIENGLCDDVTLTMLILGVVCHRKART